MCDGLKRNLKLIIVGIMVFVFFLICLTGCEVSKTSEKKIKDLEFTVCDENRLPTALVGIIQEKRKEPFKMTYNTKDYMYIVVGYGAEDRKDVGVSVSELYMTKNSIFIDTNLVVQEGDALENGLVSYPWIAVKCEKYDMPVIFK